MTRFHWFYPVAGILFALCLMAGNGLLSALAVSAPVRVTAFLFLIPAALLVSSLLAHGVTQETDDSAYTGD